MNVDHKRKQSARQGPECRAGRRLCHIVELVTCPGAPPPEKNIGMTIRSMNGSIPGTTMTFPGIKEPRTAGRSARVSKGCKPARPRTESRARWRSNGRHDDGRRPGSQLVMLRKAPKPPEKRTFSCSLPTRRKRPRCRTTEQRDELAPFTSSARASNVGGTVASGGCTRSSATASGSSPARMAKFGSIAAPATT